MILVFFYFLLSYSITPFREPKVKKDWSQIFNFQESDQNLFFMILITICTIILASSLSICLYVYCTSKTPKSQEQQRLISNKTERFSHGSNQYLTDTFQFAPVLFAPPQPMQATNGEPQQQQQQQYQPTILLQPYYPQNMVSPNSTFTVPQHHQKHSKSLQQQTNQTNNMQSQPQYVAQLIANPAQTPQFYYQSFAPMQIITQQTNQKTQPQAFQPIQPIQIIQDQKTDNTNIPPEQMIGVPEIEENNN